MMNHGTGLHAQAGVLARKLAKANRLEEEDLASLGKLMSRPIDVAAGFDLISEDQPPHHVHLVVEGYACRYKILPDGKRSIMALLLPGDFCDLHVAILGWMDHSIATISDCKVVLIDPAGIRELTEKHPRINRALWWATLVDEAVLREWIVGLGSRAADKRFAHLVCELYLRFSSVGLVRDDSFPFPLTQHQLSDVLGVTPAYMNRLIQRLRNDGLVTLRDRRMSVADFDSLAAYADFNPKYLHLPDVGSAADG